MDRSFLCDRIELDGVGPVKHICNGNNTNVASVMCPQSMARWQAQPEGSRKSAAERADNGREDTGMAGLRVVGVSKSYGRQRVLNEIDLTVADREFVVFVGPSGCGKSTLLRIIAGLEEHEAGQVFLGDTDITDHPPADRGVAMVFQSYALFPHMTVAGNMSFGLKLAGTPRPEIEQRVTRAAQILKIDELLHRKPRQLSGGQRQRVAIGRAIVRQPHIFLFDEPLSNLDAALRVEMRIELARLRDELRTTMIYVTHDQVEAMTLADRIVVLNQGRIEQVGSPLAVYRTPQTQFVAEFIGSPKMNILPGAVQGAGAAGAEIQVLGHPVAATTARPAGDAVRVGIRPEHIRLGGAGDYPLAGTVRFAEHLGSHLIAHVDMGDGARDHATCQVAIDGDRDLPHGTPVSLQFPGDAIHLFDQTGRVITPAAA